MADATEEEVDTSHHCMRCHKNYKASDKNNSSTDTSCVIEHDTDTFEGYRDGKWYVGTLECCGADQRFHRHYSDERTDPEYCYEGPHTNDTDNLRYNKYTIRPCTKKGCGEENYLKAQQAFQAQVKRSQAHKRQQEEEARSSNEAKRLKLANLQADGKRRQARYLRAEMIGYEYDEGELDSDQDPDGCEEFDYASDSSLVPDF